jgi:hypothetical protein
MCSSLISLLGLVLAMGCDQISPLAPVETSSFAPVETGPAFARHEIDHIDDRGGTFELRGLEGCFGELVIVTGTVRYKQHAMTSTETGNVDHTSFTFYLNGTGVGQTTGRVWKFKEISRERFNTPNLVAPHFTETLRLITHLIGSGSNVKVMLALHVVLSGNGITKVVVDSDKGPCSPT